ncbi:hypothetical protein PMAYCL1PPCAC_27696, partial [Pristionchus mayeri]
GRDAGDSSCRMKGGMRFFFHAQSRLCQPFLYKGCNGNGNRFGSRAECLSACADAEPPISVGHGPSIPRVICPAGNVAASNRSGPLPCDKCPRQGYECINGACCGTREFTCSRPYDAGHYPIIGWHVPMFFYSRAFNNCIVFTYFGSEGNANIFPSYTKCREFC